MITEGMATGDSASMNVDTALLHWFPDHAARSTSGWLRTLYLSSRLEGRGGLVIHVLMIEDDGSSPETSRARFRTGSNVAGGGPRSLDPRGNPGPGPDGGRLCRSGPGDRLSLVPRARPCAGQARARPDRAGCGRGARPAALILVP